MNKSSYAIGVFDSGLGGLTAVKELKKVLPNEDIIYFGDTGRVPYGTHSAETVTKYADEDLNFLLKFDIKAALVACGTVSSIALGYLKEKYTLPIYGVIQPAAASAARLSKNKRIAVFGTPATIKNGAYEKELKKIDSQIEVYPIACPMFVPLVEYNYVDRENKVTKLIAREYISKLESARPDVIILGCTHYPIIKDIIYDAACEILGDIKIVDSGASAASALKNDLFAAGILNNKENKGVCKYFVSDETYDFEKVAGLFLGEKVTDIEKIELEST